MVRWYLIQQSGHALPGIHTLNAPSTPNSLSLQNLLMSQRKEKDYQRNKPKNSKGGGLDTCPRLVYTSLHQLAKPLTKRFLLSPQSSIL